MAENHIPNNQNSTDEIDLGQLFKLIGNGLAKIFHFILRVFLYIKKHILIIVGLIITGLALGLGLNTIVSKKLKTEVIVKPQLESKNYLYDVIDEIQSNILAKDTLFFNSLGIQGIDFSGLEVSIARVVEGGSSESDLQYLELLQSFENTDAISDIVRAELQNKSSFNHRITFLYKDPDFGVEFAKKIIAYINKNNYFKELIDVYRSNASYRIEENQKLLKQVDEIIVNYTNSLATKGNKAIDDRIVLDNQEQVNIADIFDYKTLLIRDIETKKLELVERVKPISIVNFGKSQVVQKSFFGKNVVLIPITLLLGFFFISFLNYLNKKSKEL